MKILLLTKDNKLLFDSTWDEAIKQEDVDIVDKDWYMIIKLNKDYNTSAYMQVTTHEEWWLWYIDTRELD